MNKTQLEILIKLPKRHYDAVIKLINPKITDEDLKPMFPDNWSHDSKWPDFNKESNADFWKRWEPHQLRIDAELERQMGC